MGKWIVCAWKQATTKQKAYIFTWHKKSEMVAFFNDKTEQEPPLYTKIVMENQLQDTMSEFSKDQDVYNLTIWEKRDLDYEG